jgi:hypothetical protein
VLRAAFLPVAGALLLSSSALAQTDYYNIDAGRPVTIEDAYPVERYAFEVQLAPLRMERRDTGGYHWEFDPELAFGVLPGTQLEAGLHVDLTDQEGGGRSLGLAGIEVAALYNLNLETRTLPALAVAGEVLLPVGPFAPEGVHPTLKGIATRTFRWARIHVNGGYTFGSGAEAEAAVDETSHWMAGLALDRTFPLRGALFIADVHVEDPHHADGDLAWTAEGGVRYQLDPFVALDLGVGRRFTGDDPAWFVTLGAARSFGIRSLIPLSSSRGEPPLATGIEVF